MYHPISRRESNTNEPEENVSRKGAKTRSSENKIIFLCVLGVLAGEKILELIRMNNQKEEVKP